MGNAFDQFDTSQASGPPANAFDQFTPSVSAPSAPPQTTSQGLGFYKGVTTAADNAAKGLRWLTQHNVFPGIPGDTAELVDTLGEKLGLPSADQAAQTHHDEIAAQQAKGIQPGGYGEFAGDVVGTLPLMATGMGPIAAGASTGALLTEHDDPVGVLKDMAIGAATGKLADVGINALTKVAKPVVKTVGQWLTPAANRAPAVVPEAQQGADYVTRLMQSAGKGPQDLTEAATVAGTKPLTAAEAIGPTGISAVTALSRRQGATGEAASALLGERASGMRDRILDDYAQAAGVHPDAAQGNIDALVDAGRNAVDPMFKQALNVPGPIWNSELQTLANRPVLKSAIGQATEDLLNADIHPGVMGLPSGPDAGKLLPTAEAWDLIRKALGKQVDRDPFGKVIPDSISPGNRNINKTLRDLTSQLKKSIPGYGDALAASGDYLSSQTAFENGQKYILSSTLPAKKFAEQFAKLSPAEQEAFKGGTANALYNKAQGGKLYPTVFKQPILNEKLATILGPDNAKTFLKNMETEANMSKAGARMAPGTNSTTGEVMSAMNEQDRDAAGAVLDALHATHYASHGNAVFASGRIMSALKKLGAFAKTPGMPVPVRDEAGRLLLMSPTDLASHLKQLYGSGDPASVQRVVKLLSYLKAPARVAVPALSVQSASSGP